MKSHKRVGSHGVITAMDKGCRFTQHVANLLHSLPENVAMATNLEGFKTGLDNFMVHQWVLAKMVVSTSMSTDAMCWGDSKVGRFPTLPCCFTGPSWATAGCWTTPILPSRTLMFLVNSIYINKNYYKIILT